MIGDHCYDGGKKHNFEPRYDEEDGDKNLNIENFHSSPEQMKELRFLFVLKKYVGDICTWCGKPIPRINIEAL